MADSLAAETSSEQLRHRGFQQIRDLGFAAGAAGAVIALITAIVMRRGRTPPPAELRTEPTEPPCLSGRSARPVGRIADQARQGVEKKEPVGGRQVAGSGLPNSSRLTGVGTWSVVT